MMRRVSPSPTFALDARVKSMQRAGIPVINLGIGEPDFDTPAHIKSAGTKAIRDNFTHYTLTSGIMELRELIARKLAKENKIAYPPAQIIVGSGSKPLLYLAFLTICQPGDEVIVPVPTWSSYVEQIKLSGARPVFVRLVPPFKLTAKQVADKITKRTKAILINSPSNPTGALIDRPELEKIGQLAVARQLWIISDEIYEKIVYGQKYISIASLSDKVRERTITVNGFSKTYAMTGWRIGFAAGPAAIIAPMADIQGQLMANPSSIAQKAAVAAMRDPGKGIVPMIKEFQKRRDYLLKELAAIPQLVVTPPAGSFFLFIGINRRDSLIWCEQLLVKKNVAVIPGDAFFAPGYFRLSFAAKLPLLRTAVIKIREFVNEN